MCKLVEDSAQPQAPPRRRPGSPGKRAKGRSDPGRRRGDDYIQRRLRSCRAQSRHVSPRFLVSRLRSRRTDWFEVVTSNIPKPFRCEPCVNFGAGNRVRKTSSGRSFRINLLRNPPFFLTTPARDSKHATGRNPHNPARHPRFRRGDLRRYAHHPVGPGLRRGDDDKGVGRRAACCRQGNSWRGKMNSVKTHSSERPNQGLG
jgi:hypothetical protein